MSQYHDSSSSDYPPQVLVYPRGPLVSGEVITDDAGGEHPVLKVSLLVYTKCATKPVEIALLGDRWGWIAHHDPVIPPSDLSGCNGNCC